MARLTKNIRQRLLDNNNGFCKHTYYASRNIKDERVYTVSDGQLHIHSRGKTSWGGSHFDEEWIASDAETHRFLYEYQREMNWDGIE